MESVVLAIGLIVVWAIFAACFYYIAIVKWLPKFDKLPAEERVKLLETRRQRYLRLSNKKKP